MIRMIHKLDDDAEVFIIGDNRWGGLEVVRNSNLIDEIFDVESVDSKKSILDWINEQEFDAVFDPLGSFPPAWIIDIFYKSNCKKIYRHIDIKNLIKLSFKEWYRSKLLPDNLVYVPILKGRHEIDVNYDLLEAFLNKPFERTYKTWVALNKNDSVLIHYSLRKKGYLCLQPSAANGNPTPKTWHPENFLDLAGRIEVHYPQYKIVLVGDKGDEENVISKYDWPVWVINTAGKTRVDDLMNLLSNAACVVAHDSGIMHLANALGVPLIALYGPTDYTWTIPKGKKTKVLFSKTEAFAIMYKTEKSESELTKDYQNHEAMSGISVDDVFNALKGII